MSTIFLVCSTPSFRKRTDVCVASIARHYPGADIRDITYHDPDATIGAYSNGFCYFRLEKVRELLIERPHTSVVLLGADCILFSTIESLIVSEGDVVLVPHVINGPADNGKFYATGHANADVAVFRQDALKAIEWMLGQAMDGQTHKGRFYEQTLFSSLPFLGFCQVRVDTNPSLNVAYFNLEERSPNNVALFQYSGYVEGGTVNGSKYRDTPVPTNWRRFFEWYEGEIHK